MTKKTHVYRHGTTKGPPIQPYFHRLEGRAASAGWTVPDLCKAYNWPSQQPGGGVIAIVELDGGWVKSDMQLFFQQINQPMPDITDVSVDGTNNNPNQHLGDQDDPDGEVALDIQIAAASYYMATGKPATIRMYWAQDIAPAVRRATADGCDAFSCSWGSSETDYTQPAAEDMENAAEAATSQGMIVFAASGDNDSDDSGKTASVDCPASCPHVIGCGGTKKTLTSETVWNDNPGEANGEGTGGGFSRFFPEQDFQAGAPHGPGRMVPDVAANADPVTGYNVVVHGESVTYGGTSAVAPLYAGLFASFGKKLAKPDAAGDDNVILSALWSNHLCFNDITGGDNGKFRARIGPDACTGLGSPIGTKLAALFKAAMARAA
jgi:kumamolisin